MKVIAFYLPQFHAIPENDAWWGKGFTEWVNVKKAKPLFKGHDQPIVPANQNYYNLLDINVMRYQVDLAKKYGVFGFCFYHYWFDGHLLLEKPVENYLNDKALDLPFCICWANEHWTNAWISGQNKVLIEQRYGDKTAWKRHFDYLLPYLKDKRYIYKDGKPVFIIYRPELIDERKEMLDYWNFLSIQEGLKGICFMFQRPDILLNDPSQDMSMFDYCIEYQPYTSFLLKGRKKHTKLKQIKNNIGIFLEKKFSFSAYDFHLHTKRNGPIRFDYDDIWNIILNTPPLSENSIPCGFINWDNTPRRGRIGSLICGMTAKKFTDYFTKLIIKAKKEYEQDFIFFFAWNEWAEGGYLEPDEKNGYDYLEAIHKALVDTGELITQEEK